MQKLSVSTGFVFIALSAIISCTSLSDLQKGIKDSGKLVNELKGTATDIKGLVTTLTMTKTEFDKTVRVYKEGSSATTRSTVPKGQLSKFEIKRGKTQNLNWGPIAHFDNQLFPSVIISMATYRGTVVGSLAESIKSSALGFWFQATNSYIPIKYEIECVEEKFFKKKSGEFIYNQAGQKENFMPEIPWNFETLAKQETNKPVNVYFRLFDDKGNKVEQVLSITIRSIDDCILSYSGYKLDFLFSAYVQEQHPEIDKILREALNTKMVNQFFGYQGTPKDVDTQISAIWRVLHDRGFVYSSIADNAGNKGEVFSQAVRTFNSSLKTSQANCVDGTVVLASILKRIGIRPYLVSVPGHCFLGYVSWIGKDKTGKPTVGPIKYLETVMMGESGNLSRIKSGIARNKEYQRLFKEAQDEGFAKMIYNMKKYSDYVNLIDVTKERERVDPLPYYP